MALQVKKAAQAFDSAPELNSAFTHAKNNFKNENDMLKKKINRIKNIYNFETSTQNHFLIIIFNH